MNTSKLSFTRATSLLFALGMFTGCASTDSGATRVSNNYYGAGYQDLWYHGDYHDDYNVIVTPPPSGNSPDQGLRPAQPITSPPQVSRPAPQPPPSIPAAPRTATGR